MKTATLSLRFQGPEESCCRRPQTSSGFEYKALKVQKGDGEGDD